MLQGNVTFQPATAPQVVQPLPFRLNGNGTPNVAVAHVEEAGAVSPPASSLILRSESAPVRQSMRRKTMPAQTIAGSARSVQSSNVSETALLGSEVSKSSSSTAGLQTIVHVPRRSLQGVCVTPPPPLVPEIRSAALGSSVESAASAEMAFAALQATFQSAQTRTPSDVGSELSQREAFAHLGSITCLCGSRFPDDAAFCRKCGRRRPVASPQAAMPQRPMVHMCPAPHDSDLDRKIADAVKAAIEEALRIRVLPLLTQRVEQAEARIREALLAELAHKDGAIRRLELGQEVASGERAQLHSQLAEQGTSLHEANEGLLTLTADMESLRRDLEAYRNQQQSALAEVVSHRDTEVALVELRARYEHAPKENGSALQITSAEHEALQAQVGSLSESMEGILALAKSATQRTATVEDVLRAELNTEKQNREAADREARARLEAALSSWDAQAGKHNALSSELEQVKGVVDESMDRVEALKYVIEQETQERRALETSSHQRLREAEDALSAELRYRTSADEALKDELACLSRNIKIEIDTMRMDFQNTDRGPSLVTSYEVPDFLSRLQESEARLTSRLDQQQRNLELVVSRPVADRSGADVAEQLDIEARARMALGEELEQLVKGTQGKLKALIDGLADSNKAESTRLHESWCSAFDMECARRTDHEDQLQSELRTQSKAIQSLRESLLDLKRQQASSLDLCNQLQEAFDKFKQEMLSQEAQANGNVKATIAQNLRQLQTLQSAFEERLSFLEEFFADARHLFCEKLGTGWQKRTRRIQLLPRTAR
mmetsp:Transcript_21272/g.48880  ORF Transcript_21272/g.48880 Transcript_21272/m.48880 type:complete len:782 (+) Transcript_21272:57-2402(+)